MDLQQIFGFVKKTYAENNSDFWLSGLRSFIGAVWIYSGVEKIISPEFFANFPKTIAYFTSKNNFTFFADFLNNVVAPNSAAFSHLVAYGELLVGLGLLFGLLSNLSATVGIFLSAMFYLGASWTGISTAMLNVQMIALQAIILAAAGAKTLSLDYFLGLLRMRKEYVGAAPKKAAKEKKNVVRF